MGVDIGFLAIGDELLAGLTPEGNASWLGCQGDRRGLHLSRTATVGDKTEEIVAALRWMESHCSVIFTSGGLGPTQDDRTREALALYRGFPLEECPEAREVTKKHYERRGIKWEPGQNDYGLVPRGFRPVYNPLGLAPGLAGEGESGSLILLAPGPPREFRGMVEEEFFPLLEGKNLMASGVKRVVIRTAGLGEEKIFSGNNFWRELEAFGKVASLPVSGGVDIVLTLEDGKEEVAPLWDFLKSSSLVHHIYSWDEGPLGEVVVRRARASKKSFAFAESCTGGQAASEVTDIAGVSEVFRGSFVTYTNEMKVKILGVREETLAVHGAVSREVAREMACGARDRGESSFGLAFSGLLGPGGDGGKKRVGTLALGLAGPEDALGWCGEYQGSRRELKARFVRLGLLALLGALDTSFKGTRQGAGKISPV